MFCTVPPHTPTLYAAVSSSLTTASLALRIERCSGQTQSKRSSRSHTLGHDVTHYTWIHRFCTHSRKETVSLDDRDVDRREDEAWRQRVPMPCVIERRLTRATDPSEFREAVHLASVLSLEAVRGSPSR